MTPSLLEACKQALHVIEPEGRVLTAGRAALAVLEQIGYPRSAKLLQHRPWIWVVELGYRLVSRHRPFFSRILFRGS
jgi:hypothetical protein